MKRNSRVLLGVFLSVVAIISLFTFIKSNKGLIKEEEIQSNIISRLNTMKNYSDVKHVTIEKRESISGTMVILYSVNNPPQGVKTYGLATYKRMSNGKLKPMSHLVTKEIFGTEFVNLGSNSPYLLVYGFNPNNKTQVYKHISGNKEEIVEFSGEYFVEKFPGDAGNRFERIYSQSN